MYMSARAFQRVFSIYLAKFGFDTAGPPASQPAENEHCKICPLSYYRSPRWKWPNGRRPLRWASVLETGACATGDTCPATALMTSELAR